MNNQSPDNKLRKDKIITEIFKTGVIQKKVDNVCFKNFISHDTYIHEDVLNEVFLQLAKMDTDKFLDWYDRSPSNIEGLAVTIAKRAFMSHTVRTDYPKHSIVKALKFTSTFDNIKQLDHTDQKFTTEYTDHSLILLSDEVEDDSSALILKKLMEHLDAEEVDFLENYMDMEGHWSIGRRTKSHTEMKAHVFEKIRNINSEFKFHKINNS